VKNVKIRTVIVLETTWTEDDFECFEDGNQPRPIEGAFERHVEELKSHSRDELTEIQSDMWDSGRAIFESGQVIAQELVEGEE
jgi:hypothetical protein